MEEINNIEKDAEDFEGEYLCSPSAGHDIFFDRHSFGPADKNNQQGLSPTSKYFMNMTLLIDTEADTTSLAEWD